MSVDESSWRTAAFRQSVVVKIDEAIQRSGMPTSKNSMEMENHVFQKAKTKEEYLGFVARLILHVREMNSKKAAGMGGPNPAMQDPINALQTLARQGTGNTQMMGMGGPQGVGMVQQQQPQSAAATKTAVRKDIPERSLVNRVVNGGTNDASDWEVLVEAPCPHDTTPSRPAIAVKDFAGVKGTLFKAVPEDVTAAAKRALPNKNASTQWCCGDFEALELQDTDSADKWFKTNPPPLMRLSDIPPQMLLRCRTPCHSGLAAKPRQDVMFRTWLESNEILNLVNVATPIMPTLTLPQEQQSLQTPKSMTGRGSKRRFVDPASEETCWSSGAEPAAKASKTLSSDSNEVPEGRGEYCRCGSALVAVTEAMKVGVQAALKIVDALEKLENVMCDKNQNTE